MVPEVPEVSLCFNQEKNQPVQSNKGSSFQNARNIEDRHIKRYQQNGMLHRNQNESYNTWKTKNAEMLHNITGGQEWIESGLKQVPNTKRSAGLVRKQTTGNEMYSPSIVAAKYSTNGTPEQVNSFEQNINPNADYRPRLGENHTQLQTTLNQPSNSYPVQHQQIAYPMRKQSFPQHRTRDPQKVFQQTEETIENPASSNLQNHSCKDKIVTNNPYMVSDRTNHNGSPVIRASNYCNKLQCSCEKPKPSLNGNEFVCEPPLTEEPGANSRQFVETKQLYPTLDAGLINSNLSSLSHILTFQKEQITMLCQDMSTQKILMSMLLDEVKQIHAAVSPSIQINRDMPQSKKNSCQNCTCEQNGNQEIRKEDSMKVQIKHNGHSASKQTPTVPDNIEKRSIGVMTTSLDNIADSTLPFKDNNKSQRLKHSAPKSRKPHKKPKVPNSPSPKKNQPTNKKDLTRKEEKRKLEYNQTQRRKKREESNESSQSNDSFSLDEAAVVMRTETEPGNVSPDVSIHVSMADYSSSSTGSDTSNSSDSDDGGQESGSEGESSDPQIGWTFYDRVVGQVNNMLKKTSNDSKQEYAHTQRKNTGSVLYQCNGDYETENNWSKRVTFDGPPLEESDNNAMHLPRYHHYRTNQEYRMPPGPENMQDFMVCDYANGGNNLSLVNGSTNVSFATYRYYQRHQLLPPVPPSAGARVPDQVFIDSPQMKKKKSKSKKSERTPPMAQKSHKNRNGGHPSKILDVSALKQQPKLF